MKEFIKQGFEFRYRDLLKKYLELKAKADRIEADNIVLSSRLSYYDDFSDKVKQLKEQTEKLDKEYIKQGESMKSTLIENEKLKKKNKKLSDKNKELTEENISLRKERLELLNKIEELNKKESLISNRMAKKIKEITKKYEKEIEELKNIEDNSQDLERKLDNIKAVNKSIFEEYKKIKDKYIYLLGKYTVGKESFNDGRFINLKINFRKSIENMIYMLDDNLSTENRN